MAIIAMNPIEAFSKKEKPDCEVSSKSDLTFDYFLALIAMNLITPKAAAELELFSKSQSQ
jgi:hypothetical protein